MITYGNLYDYLESIFRKSDTEELSDYYYTLKFCEHHKIVPDRILQILFDFGCHNDIEILLNLPLIISEKTDINKDLETPVEYAIKHNLYARFHEGMWVRCKKSQNGALPDLNTAYQRMFPNKKRKL